MDGLPVIEAPKLGEATSAIAVGGGRIAQLDTGSSRWIIDAKPGNIRSPVFSSDASEKKQSNLEDTVTRKDKVMPIAMKDTRPYAVAAAKQNIDQTAKSSESFEQRLKLYTLIRLRVLSAISTMQIIFCLGEDIKQHRLYPAQAQTGIGLHGEQIIKLPARDLVTLQCLHTRMIKTRVSRSMDTSHIPLSIPEIK